MPQGEHDGLSEETEMKTAIAAVFLRGHTIHFPALIAVAVVAIPLVLSVIHAEAQGADNLPRPGETTAEYNIRMARTQGDRAALHEALREAQEKAYREALREKQERIDAATKRYEKAVKNLDQTIKNEKARNERARQIECNRSSQRAALDWSASATRLYEKYCTD
jgi:hypothetical protein